jgi:hypothetical protein
MNELSHFLSDTTQEEQEKYSHLFSSAFSSSASNEDFNFFSDSVIPAIVLCGSSCIDTIISAAKLWMSIHKKKNKNTTTKIVVTGGVGHSTGILYEAIRNENNNSFIKKTKTKEILNNLLLRNNTEQQQQQNAVSEAEIFSSILQDEYDIPTESILVERESTNCGNNAELSMPIVHRLCSSSSSRSFVVPILQDPTMQRRSRMSFEKHHSLLLSLTSASTSSQEGGDGAAVANPSQLVNNIAFVSVCVPFSEKRDYRSFYDTERYMSLLLGEIPRLRNDASGYGPAGKNFIGECIISEEVEESYQELKNKGAESSDTRRL